MTKFLNIIRAILLRFFLVILSVGLTLLVLEGMVRLFFPQQLVYVNRELWTATDNGRGWAHLPFIDTTVNTGEGEVRFLTDAFGYRIGEETVEQPEIQILALGDSFLEALQVEYADSMTGILEIELSNLLGRSVRVVNTGVAGYDPNHYRIVLEQELAANDYDMVLVFLYSGNDIVDYQVNQFEPRPSQMRSLRWPQNLSVSELVDAWLYPINDYLEQNSHLFVLFRNSSRVLLARLGLSKYYISEAVQISHADDEAWATTAAILNEIQQSAGDIPLHFVLIPEAYQVDESILDWYLQAFPIEANELDLQQPPDILAFELAQYNIEIIDMLPILRESGLPNLYGRIDTHLDIGGHRIVAETLTPILSKYLEN